MGNLFRAVITGLAVAGISMLLAPMNPASAQETKEEPKKEEEIKREEVRRPERPVRDTARSGRERGGDVGRQVETRGQQPGTPGERPQRGRRGGREPVAAEPAAVDAIGDFSGNVDQSARLLRIQHTGKKDSADALVVINKEFQTEVILLNQDRTPFDQIRIVLSYEPDFLEPLAINDSAIAANIEGEPKAEVDPLLGLITYEAVLKTPAVIFDAPVLKIDWQARKVTYSTRIDFTARDGFHTTLNHQGRDILGSEKEPGDGTLSMLVTILPEDEREAAAMMNAPRLLTRPDEKVGGVRLFLKPQEEPIHVGEPFHVDVILDNRATSMLDGLNLLIEYDSSTLEVLDADYNNWITRGINIHDGPFRTEFPWDFIIANTVYPSRGLISYRVGSGTGEITRGKSGTVARIYAVAKQPTLGTPLVFKFSARARTNATAATYMGQDALGDTKIFGDGTKGALVRVNPPRQGDLAAASSKRRSDSN